MAGVRADVQVRLRVIFHVGELVEALVADSALEVLVEAICLVVEGGEGAPQFLFLDRFGISVFLTVLSRNFD